MLKMCPKLYCIDRGSLSKFCACMRNICRCYDCSAAHRVCRHSIQVNLSILDVRAVAVANWHHNNSITRAYHRALRRRRSRIGRGRL